MKTINYGDYYNRQATYLKMPKIIDNQIITCAPDVPMYGGYERLRGKCFVIDTQGIVRTTPYSTYKEYFK